MINKEQIESLKTKSYRTVRIWYIFMLITLILFVIILSITLTLTSVTGHKLQHVLFQGINGVLSDMRRFTITAIIVVVITVKLFF